MNMNIMRITGMVSGMDTDQMVKDLMKIEYTKVDSLKQDKQIYEWQQDMYRELNSALLSLKNETFDMKLEENLKAMSAASSDTTKVTTTVSPDAVEGNYTISISQIASGAQASSAASISKAITGNALGYPVTIDASHNEFKVTLDGVQKAIVLDTKTYDGTPGNTLTDLQADVQSKVDAAFGAGKISMGLDVDKLTFEPAGDYKPEITLSSGDSNDALTILGFSSGDSFKIDTTSSLKSISDKFDYDPFSAGDTISFKINDQLFEYDFSAGGTDENATLQDILNDINGNENANVKAYYDSVTDKIVIQSKDTGLGSEVKIENISGNLFGANGAIQIGDGTTYGQNAEFTLNGIDISKTSNSFSINGVNYHLLDATAADVTITVEKDSQTIFDNVKNFVEKYNEVLDKFNTKLSEKRYRDYIPLTDEQKQGMSDSEIELWEEKAKSGLISNDSSLSMMVNNMRRYIYETVEDSGGTYTNLSEIGISTTDYRENGKLHIDEDKLMEAINNNIDDVMKLFTNDSETGVMDRLYDELDDDIDTLTDKAGSATGFAIYDSSSLGKTIYSLAEEIDEMNVKLFEKENSLYEKFAAMESALSRMNSQSAWLSQQFGGTA